MMHDQLPEIVDKALTAMQDIPVPDPTRQAAARRAFLAQARQLRQQQPVSRRASIRHIGWMQNWIQNKETLIMTPLAKALAVVVVVSGLATGTARSAPVHARR